ncbi:hypothetical protein J3R30DRAFT_224395 [Lentinula aciculospora]|uniref:Fucose-specific lectin n=1 Tax=Lentinula aciculospora TaxID=153920 RepID=A0A9W9DNH9_9AGAR|nr:hypothetical protein J3R30DRAFT_224395 [Lentinula aciculospora]
MTVLKFYLILPLYLMFLLKTLANNLSNLTADAVVPISGTNMGAVQLPDGNTRVYYQDGNNGSIVQLVISDAFNVGNFKSSNVWVPSSQVRENSPVAVSLVANGNTFVQIHVFFFSRENILSEYYWKGNGPQGGAGCSDCVTSKGFVGVADSQMLYAMASSATSPPTLRVGFVSAGAPNTISEAVNDGSGWSVASLST